MSDQYVRDSKRMAKKHLREMTQMLANLHRYHEVLEEANNPLLLTNLSFVHREVSGTHAITQQPLHSATQTRLYAYCFIRDKKIHLICIGDKHSQHRDNQFCKNT